VQLATADDGDRWVRCWTRRLRRPDGQRIEVGVHLDVTEQRRAEALQTEAERAARLSQEKSAFMALMSHRLRTPLNAVLGFTQLLAQDVTEPLGQRQRERLARIDSAGQELLAMVDDVFELAQLDVDGQTSALLPVPASQLVSQVHEAVQPLARQRGVQLRVDDKTGAATLATDRRRLGQALVHLMSHGVRTSERGGWVGLQAAVQGDRCQITLRLGSGPDEAGEQRELAFDTVAAPLEHSGSGDALIGLDLVRQVLERLGARVEWPSTEGALRLALPLAAPAVPPASGLKLLCIEDNPVNLMLVRELVAMRPSIQFHSADDGLSGLALAAAHRPDVVLLDLQLPDIPGAEVLARIRMQPALAHCRVIALSANAIPDDIRASREAGFDDYWTKPIDFDRFLAGLDRLASARR
jgi:CheY-like chemotaxis protein/nitrogen-specific signal transduction histidine kinase